MAVSVSQKKNINGLFVGMSKQNVTITIKITVKHIHTYKECGRP